MTDHMPVQSHMVKVTVTDQHRATGLMGRPGSPAMNGKHMPRRLEITEAMLQVRQAISKIETVVRHIALARFTQRVESLPIQGLPLLNNLIAIERVCHSR